MWSTQLFGSLRQSERIVGRKLGCRIATEVKSRQASIPTDVRSLPPVRYPDMFQSLLLRFGQNR